MASHGRLIYIINSYRQCVENTYYSSKCDNKKVHKNLSLAVRVQVRTKDQLFNSVGHLIDFHMSNGVPIVSADSELVLVTPVMRGSRET